jgi:integrase
MFIPFLNVPAAGNFIQFIEVERSISVLDLTIKPAVEWAVRGFFHPLFSAGIDKGRLLRSVSKSGRVNRDSLSDWAVWSVVEQSSKQIGLERFGAHDLRRTCAKLCRKNGGDLEQIKFLLGHSSIQTTERYLGSEQDIEIAVNDNLGL